MSPENTGLSSGPRTCACRDALPELRIVAVEKLKDAQIRVAGSVERDPVVVQVDGAGQFERGPFTGEAEALDLDDVPIEREIDRAVVGGRVIEELELRVSRRWPRPADGRRRPARRRRGWCRRRPRSYTATSWARRSEGTDRARCRRIAATSPRPSPASAPSGRNRTPTAASTTPRTLSTASVREGRDAPGGRRSLRRRRKSATLTVTS